MSEADYIYEIKQLVELQKVDDEIFDVHQHLDNAPRDLEDLQRQFAGAEGRRNHVLDKIMHMKEQKKRLSNEIEDDGAKIKKSKSKLMQVENTREYQAVIREMESMEKINRTREEEKNTLQVELDNQNKILAQIEEEYENIKKTLDEKRESMDATLQEGKDKLHKLSIIREEVSRDITRPIFQRYEFIRSRLEHPVIVSVDNGICSGCNIAIPPQAFIELQSGQQILSCPNCQRLIFWSNFFEDPSDSGNKKKPPLQAREDSGDDLEDMDETEMMDEDAFSEDAQMDDEEKEED